MRMAPSFNEVADAARSLNWGTSYFGETTVVGEAMMIMKAEADCLGIRLFISLLARCCLNQNLTQL
jgi:hypothetical protein